MTSGNLRDIVLFAAIPLRGHFRRPLMSDDRKPTSKPDDKVPGEATPHDPGLGPKPGDPDGESKPSPGAPYDKKGDPEQQPS